jgi:hypothetical protein
VLLFIPIKKLQVQYMFNKIFKKYTVDDLLNTLKDKVFIDSKADDILKQVDINYRDLEDRSFLHHVVEKT